MAIGKLKRNLKKLQQENAKLRAAQQKLDKIKRLQEERARLLKENKQLSFRVKHGRAVDISQKVAGTTTKFGKSAFRGLQKLGQRLAEAERREKAYNKKLKSAVKQKSMKKRR
jgi:hypothetical protein